MTGRRHAPSQTTTGSPPEWLIQAESDSCQNLSAMKRQQKITLGEMRSSNGPRRLIVYCSDYQCAHSVVIDAGRWSDDVRLSDLEPKFTCKVCGAAAPMSGRYSNWLAWERVLPETASRQRYMVTQGRHRRNGVAAWF